MTILIRTRPSSGAKLLTSAVRSEGFTCLRRRPGTARPLRSSSFLVNWGVSSEHPAHINKPSAVAVAVNKLSAFQCLSRGGVRVPGFMEGEEFLTVNAQEECSGIWLARHSLTGSGGEGITVVRPGEKFPDAPLYVPYVPKLVEFRCHVFRHADGFRILNRQKLRESSAEQSRDQRLIRNRENGWVFGLVRDTEGEVKAQHQAVKAIQALGLDFGAVDVIIGRDDGLAYVLEVNTAPGLESDATLDFYKSNIIEHYRRHNDTAGQA